MWHFGNILRWELSTHVGSLTVLAVALISGCGGGGHKAATSEPSSRPAAGPERVATASQGDQPAPRKSKYDDIPYDAFFDNPLEVVANSAVVARPESGSAAAPAAAAEKPAAPAKSAGGLVWSEYFPAEEVQSEVKKIQNHLKASMQGQGTYNGNYKDIAVDGSVLAAMAGVALEHDGEVSWKANAALIREFGYELSQSATGLGKENFEKSKLAFEKLESVFSGSIPADAPKADPKRPLHEVAGREGLMKRIEKARNHLRDNINTEAKLKGDAESVLHETLIIAVLGKIVAGEGYSSADEEDYQQYAEALISGAKEAAAAARDQSFQKFTDSMNKVNKSCDQCHANYGNG